jgi:uncharacterized protein (TIGR02147 family)
MKDARYILTEILSERRASNPSYSLRAFARDLSVSPQQLSNVMTGRRGLSEANAEKIAVELNLDAHEALMFRESLKAKFSLSKTQRLIAQTKLSELQPTKATKNLQIDLFKTISNWYHLTLVELIRISKPAKQSAAGFSKKLDVPEIEVNLALGRLERLELISKSGKGWSVNQDVVIFDQAIPSEAIKNFHRQVLEKAAKAMAFQSPAERYGSTSTIPVKVKSVEKAKKLIQKFRSDFAKEISDLEGGEEIYALSLQFFKLTQTEKGNENYENT